MCHLLCLFHQIGIIYHMKDKESVKSFHFPSQKGNYAPKTSIAGIAATTSHPLLLRQYNHIFKTKLVS